MPDLRAWVTSFSDSGFFFSLRALEWLQNAVDCLQKSQERWILNITLSLLICSVSSFSGRLEGQQTPVLFSHFQPRYSQYWNIICCQGSAFCYKCSVSSSKKGSVNLTLLLKPTWYLSCFYYPTAFNAVQLKIWKWIQSSPIDILILRSGIEKEDATTLTKPLNIYKNTSDYSIIYIINMGTANIKINWNYWIESLYTSQGVLIILFL